MQRGNFVLDIILTIGISSLIALPALAEDKPTNEKSAAGKAAATKPAQRKGSAPVITAPGSAKPAVAEKSSGKDKKPVKDAKATTKDAAKGKTESTETVAAPVEKFVAKVRVLVAKSAKGDSNDVKVAKAAVGLAEKSWSADKAGHVAVQIDELSDAKEESLKKFFSASGSEVVVSLLPGEAKVSDALIKLSEESGTPLVGARLPSKSVLGRGRTMTFHTTTEQVTAAEAQKRGYKNIARISTADAAITALREAFDAAHSGRIRRVMDEEFAADVQDFSSYIGQLKNKKGVEAVMVLLAPAQAGTFAAQLRKADVKLPIFGFSSLADSAAAKAAGGALLGAWYVSIGEPTESFTKSYKAIASGADESEVYLAAQVHDAVTLVANGAEKATSRETVNQYLHTVKDFRGAFGTYSANSATNSFTLPVAVKVIGQK